MIWLWVIFISISWTLSCIAWYVNIRWLHLTPFFEHKHEVKFFSSATVLQMKCFSPWCSKSCICCSDAPAQAVPRGLWEHILSNTVQCSKCIDIWMCWRTPPRGSLRAVCRTDMIHDRRYSIARQLPKEILSVCFGYPTRLMLLPPSMSPLHRVVLVSPGTVMSVIL